MCKYSKVIRILSISLLVLGISFCSGKYFKFEVKEQAELRKIGCISVLPFKNLSKSKEASSIVPELLIAELTSGEIFRITPFSSVLEEISSINLASELYSNPTVACKIGEKLKTEGVITGIVTEYSYIGRGENFYEPRLGFSVSLYEVKGCKLIMSADVARTKTGLSVSRKDSLSSLAMKSMGEISRKFSENIGPRMLDFKYRCGGIEEAEETRCIRNPSGWIDFEKCPEAIPGVKFSGSDVSIEGEELILKDRVNFIPGKNFVSFDSHALLKKLVKFANKKRIRVLRVESYISGTPGSPEEDLSLDRAGAVRKFLLDNGLRTNRVDTINFVLAPDVLKGKDIPAIRFVVVQ